LANPASATIFYLRLAGHTMRVTHADGNPIEPISTDGLRIGMGERYDVVFEADDPERWLHHCPPFITWRPAWRMCRFTPQAREKKKHGD
jgi:FtsP/CotA-like multicopper oxidase with cupredoxin domain